MRVVFNRCGQEFVYSSSASERNLANLTFFEKSCVSSGSPSQTSSNETQDEDILSEPASDYAA